MVRAEVDAQVGGRFVFVDWRKGEGVQHTGEYLQLERPKRLVFSFSVPMYSCLAIRVAVNIVPTDSGLQLTLVHEGVLPEYQAATQ
jgi:uncharacterized protein YndB with AHSA1/START domain